MNHPILKFIGWDRPAISLVADELLKWNETDSDAFRRAVVVLPTAESGRRLREHMAERAGRPLLMPRVTLLGQLIPCDGAASELETLAAWMRVCRKSPAEKRRSASTRVIDMAASLCGVCRQLELEGKAPDYKREDFDAFIAEFLNDDAARWSAAVSEEERRWRSLQILSAEADAVLESWGKLPVRKVHATAIAAAACRPLGHKIILCCIPEVLPLYRCYLESCCRADPASVEIWVNAPADMSSRFDAFGQPLAEYWSKCAIDIPAAKVLDSEGAADDAQSSIHVVQNARAMGARARSLAGGKSSRELVLGCCDAEFAPYLVTSFAPAWRLNLPGGRSFMTTAAALLPRLMAAACRALDEKPLYDEESHELKGGDSMPAAAFMELVRNPFVQSVFCEPGEHLEGLNAHLDLVDSLLLPAGVGRLLDLLKPGYGLPFDASDSKVRRLLGQRREDYAAFCQRVYDFLLQCMSPKSLPGCLNGLAQRVQLFAMGEDVSMQAALGKMAEALQGIAGFCGGLGCDVCEVWDLADYCVSGAAQGALAEMRRADTVLDVLGWRELPFALGDTVIIAGMHEGHVPERLPADAYLPEAFRSFAKLGGNMERNARDSFLLTALLQAKGRRVHFLVSKLGVDGLPLVPSSLLLRCGDDLETLADRASWLFADLDEVFEEKGYDSAALFPVDAQAATDDGMESVELIAPGVANPYADPERTFSPSKISAFLRCPLRFWLKELLGISPGDAYDPDKVELDSLEYGSLLHAVLKDLAEQYRRKPGDMSTKELEGLMLAEADRLLDAKLGGCYADKQGLLSIPLESVRRNMKASLHAFVACHVKDLFNGWEVCLLEQTLATSMPSDGEMPFLFSMKVDRVDYHPALKKWRIIDYKTSSYEPNKKYYATMKSPEVFERFMPGFKLLENGNAKWRWADVQLPLYAYALMHCESELPAGAYPSPETELSQISMGYYLLPKGKPAEVEFKGLTGKGKDPFGEGYLDSAMDWVRHAAGCMRAGKCLYSAESLGYDAEYGSFGALCAGGDLRSMFGLPLVSVEDFENN